MDRGTRELIRGPFVKFRTKTAIRTGYIVNQGEGYVIVWSNGKPMRVRNEQILFREE